MAEHGLHKHAFWLYGVIVGLAIQEGLQGVLPHLLDPPNNESRWFSLQEGLRFTTFLILIVRFYLGSGFYFDKAHGEQSPYKVRSYGLDFLFGIVHFLLFYVCAVSIDLHSGVSPSLFRWFLFGILLYDLVWWIASVGYDTAHALKLWACFNAFTALVALSTFVVLHHPLRRPVGEAEGFALIIIMLASLLDLVGMVLDRSIIRELLHKLLREEPETSI